MHPAQAMVSCGPLPSGASLLGYIDRHPADKGGLGYGVLIYHATGIEVAWDGSTARSLPDNWRKKVTFIPVNPAALLGARGGAAKTEAKAEAARANGKKGGRPKKAKAT